MGTAVTLERYAEMRAEMDGGGLHDSVLARAGITAEEWIAAQREWLERMGMELERGRLELTNRYTQAFLARQRALRALDSPSRPVVEAAPLPAAAPPPVPAPSTVPRPPMIYAAPTTPENGPAQEPRAVTPPSLSPEALAAIMAVPDEMPGSTTMPLPSSAQAQVAAKSLLPFKSGEPVNQPQLAAASRGALEMHRSGGTLPPPASETARGVSKGSLPFQPIAAPSMTKAPEQVAAKRPPLPHPSALLAAGETANLTAFVGQLRDMNKGALPFSAKAEQVTGGSQASQTSAERAPKGVPPAALDVTGDIAAAVQEHLRTASAAPLPFRSTNPTPPPSLQIPSQGSSPDARLPAQGARADQTVAASLVPKHASELPFSTPPKPQPPAPIRRPTPSHGLPFNAPPDPPADAEDGPTIYQPMSLKAAQPAVQPPPQIPTLVVYAQICAELRLDPARAGFVRARYQLADDSAWGGALRYWQAQLNDPATRERWTRLVEQMMHTAGAKR